MQLVTVGSKYQIVIPKEIRKKIKGINPGAKVAVSANEQTVTVKPAAKSWSDENYGVIKKYLKGVDLAVEVDKARDEWEERANELEKL